MDLVNILNILFDDDDTSNDPIQSRENHIRFEGYFENILNNYSLTDFKSHFHLSRVTFQLLIEKIGPCLLRNGLTKINPEKQLAITLWILGNQEPSQHKITESQQNFAAIANFPGIIGVIDGCHISISAPTEYPNNYINRKGFHSIILQAICDENKNFISVFTGYCGSVHDSRVWQNSDIKRAIDNNQERFFPNNTHLLGDAAYPLTKHLLTPYKNNGHLNNIQKNYNKKLSTTRLIIERAFGLLKARFRKLYHVFMFNTDMIPLVIITCCILHNICLNSNDEPFEPNLNDTENEYEDDSDENDEDVFFNAKEKRNIIANMIN
ncbi:putative nuclease HARBI1 [Prorops nasuta]|uniref:putative nuclease HARBI1 n=1 Tax=Prorops nasuta TaxID=863751 RepID=UPI0034CE89EA